MKFWELIPPPLQTVLQVLSQYPFVLLLVIIGIFFLVAWLRKAYPTRLMLGLSFIPFPLSLGVVFYPPLGDFVVILDSVLILFALYDLTTTASKRHLQAERQALRVASIQKNHDVSLVVSNRSRRSLKLEIKDDLPQDFEPSVESFTVRLAPRSRITLRYKFKSHARGKFFANYVHVRASSRLRLWKTHLRIPVQSEFNVYPDMKQLGQYAVMARTNRLSLLGVRRTRKVGQDNEFERLRDYTKDDNYRHIDWRSTARRNKLTVRDFQTNQSQRIIFMMDCGRMMTNRSGDISLLDHSLNAMLMMSYVALRQGDSVGLVCFSDKIHRYVPPRSGMAQMNHLLHSTFDRFPELVESRYDQAFLYLATHCPKRSLVVLITNVFDDVNSHQIEQYLGSLVGRHLPMGVLLRDRSIFDIAEAPATSVDRVYEAAAAAEILTWRHQVITDLEHRGVLSLDVFPEDMTAPMINRYLDIKARHLL